MTSVNDTDLKVENDPSLVKIVTTNFNALIETISEYLTAIRKKNSINGCPLNYIG